MRGAVIRESMAVARARASGTPLVALESSVLAQGLPVPANREAHTRMADAVQAVGATPAITAVVHGVPTVGLEDDELARFLRREGVRKASARDLAAAIAQCADAATTVAAAMWLAHCAGIDVLATGGIGGVHREAAFDESADLHELARTPVVVVCAGAKSILDLPATMERLETLGVPVIGYGTDEVPGFFTAQTGIPVPARADSIGALVDVIRAHRRLGRTSGLLVVQPPPVSAAIDAATIDAAVRSAVDGAVAQRVSGAFVTPHLLDAVAAATAGRSQETNLALLAANATLGAQLAVALAGA